MRDSFDEFLLTIDANEDIEPLDLDVPALVPDEQPQPRVVESYWRSVGQWLKDYIHRNGPQTPEEIQAAAKKAGLDSSEVMRRAKNKNLFVRKDGKIELRQTSVEWLQAYLKTVDVIAREDLIAAGVAVGHARGTTLRCLQDTRVRQIILPDGRVGLTLGTSGVDRRNLPDWIRDYLLEHGETYSRDVAEAAIAAGAAKTYESCRSTVHRSSSIHSRKIGTKVFWSIQTRRGASLPNISSREYEATKIRDMTE